MCAGYCQGGFGCGVVGVVEETAYPWDRAGAFDAKDAGVAGAQDFEFFFWLVARPSGSYAGIQNRS